jgi:uncharacterized protein YbjT (DUF2867 family)
MKKVLVTGATGKTGSIVLQKLRQLITEFTAVGLARNEVKIKQMFGTTDGFIIGDIQHESSLQQAVKDCQGLVILTSAVPIMKAPPQPGQRPEFYFADGEMPEQIDYYGQKNQIDAAKKAGVEHIVLVSSMGVTNVNHPLNSIGNGNILIWKRKAEEYLVNSGVDYTIIHPGGLIDQPGGLRELVIGKNDQLINNPPEGIATSIPRADVAELVVQCLREPSARNKSFDVISKPENDSTTVITTDFVSLLEQTTSGL